ncbi:glutamate-5-semialdehyde dehydrogenase [Rhodospirillaceae bacterium KN72]|uniref:Gamma-glutamyl phosphate reductase n=1 Tax=Pacificispira spongiicola TaxID=2729598 RepID=A0A7Y0E225_9PROT|nr:glutamate-5-semialdehyde dehydrogenase [Pacificispira spongiicola]NMM45723.1 glutamate-5-semialdehyde dehydrogenase [Pacificispira spongiicola]
MNETLATAENAEEQLIEMAHRARKACRALGLATPAQRTDGLRKAAAAVRTRAAEIEAANAKDMAFAKEKGLSPAMLDRLLLNADRIEAMASGLESVAELPDPVGQVIAEWDRPNGLHIERVRTPLGVIGVIYESRPNVTADAGALCVKAGNAAILRGGSESLHSSGLIADCLRQGLAEAGLPEDAVQIARTRDRDFVGAMLGASGLIDVIVPRGGRNLIERVLSDARVPVFAHLEGLVHLYIHEAADPEKAVVLAVNSKMRRTGICGAAETLLIDRSVAAALLPKIASALIEVGCVLRGDAAARAVMPIMEPASDEDWRTEYLDSILSVRVVDGIDQAMTHIADHGSDHTDCIVTEDQAVADRFLNEVDSAIVMHNASTQFADGGEFGMGAEIGISTGRMHARGPVGAEQLTSFKYRVRGNGQTRP